jgi:actin-like ATPase involved in cell morphogenesis
LPISSEEGKDGRLEYFIQAVMSMVSDVTHVEQRALLNAAEDAGIGKVFMMEEGLAAAFGVGVLPS